MANFDQNVSLKQGSDTGQSDAQSIQPIGPAEVVWSGTSNRPLENLRERTETLRRYMQTTLYYLDYDRALLLRSNAAFTLTEPVAGQYELSMVGDDLWAYPSLTPGRNSGGRARGGRVFIGGLPYAGTPLVNDLILTASAQYTGQRGYSDADAFSTANSLTLGANRITVDLLADGTLGTGVVAFSVTETPKTKITIRYGTNGGTTTLATLITAINADLSSQGTYGVAAYLRASTTSASPATVSPTPFVGGIVQGAYDAEAHQVTAAQMAAFFAATEGGVQVNRLREGEGLAIGYPKGPVEAGVPVPRGGRRQSLWDLPTDRVGGSTQNVSPTVGWSLFSTGREPEKIPGAVPLGKILHGEFIFIDGTRVGVGETIRLSESRVMRASLASTIFGAAGASLVGYDGSGFWNADASITANPSVPAGTLDAGLDAIVAHLATSTTSNSGARRVGVESASGSGSTGNRVLGRSPGSIRQALDAVLNTAPTSTAAGGVNYRVSEDGHELKGLRPIHKDFSALTNGAQRFSALLRPTGNLEYTRPGVVDFADLVLQPMESGGASGLQAKEPVTLGSNASRLKLNAGDIATRFAAIWPKLPYFESRGLEDSGDRALIQLIFVKVQGLVSPTNTENGLYIFERFTSDTGPTRGEFILRKMDNTPADFSAVTNASAATASFLSALVTGGTDSNTKLAVHQPPGLYPSVVLGMDSGTQPWLEVLCSLGSPAFTPGSGRTVLKGLVLYGDRGVWHPGQADERDTNNILIRDDKTLLQGVETGAPVDATLNHHHGGTYHKLHFFNEEVTLVDRTDISTMTPDTSNFIPKPPNSGVSAIPTGYAVDGWLLRIQLRVTAQNASYVIGGCTIEFRRSNTNPNPMFRLYGQAQTWNSVGLNDSFHETAPILPVNASTGDIEYRLTGPINVQSGALRITCYGYCLRRL